MLIVYPNVSWHQQGRCSHCIPFLEESARCSVPASGPLSMPYPYHQDHQHQQQLEGEAGQSPQTPKVKQRQRQQGTPLSNSSKATRSPHIRPSPSPTGASPSSLLKHRHIHRVPPPAILPPLLDSTNSALHLTLRSEAGSTLSTQVDELLSRHLAQTPTAGGDTSVHVRSGNPATKDSNALQLWPTPPFIPQGSSYQPPLPPKSPKPDLKAASPAVLRTIMATPQAVQPRRPLPVPPKQDSMPHQYPASYGPSISKIRSFPAEVPLRYNGLPPGAAHMPSAVMPGKQGLGYGHPHPQLAATAYAGQYPKPGRNINAPIPVQQSTISRTFAKGGASIMLHKGFCDLLSLSASNAPQSNSTIAPDYGQGWLGDKPILPPAGRIVTTPVFRPQSASTAPQQAKGYRRISVDMVGKPTGFA